MDAFSLALSIGTLGIKKNKILTISTVVGLFHFFMPLLGHLLGLVFTSIISVNAHFISAIIFFYIAIQMFKESKEDTLYIGNMSPMQTAIFALGVSIDSFGVGFVTKATRSELIIMYLIFAFASMTFTFFGLSLGKILSDKWGSYASYLGIAIMAILSVINFVKFCAFN